MGEKVKQDHFKYKHTLNKEKSYLQTFNSWKKSKCSVLICPFDKSS